MSDISLSSPATASWASLFQGRNGSLAIALTGGVALHAVNVHIVTTVLPSVVQDIGGLDWYAWSTTLFVVASIIGAALSVRLLAVLGPRAACIAALAVFALGSAACASALSMPWLLAGRSVQGLGGGVLAALSYALIQVVFVPALWRWCRACGALPRCAGRPWAGSMRKPDTGAGRSGRCCRWRWRRPRWLRCSCAPRRAQGPPPMHGR